MGARAFEKHLNKYLVIYLDMTSYLTSLHMIQCKEDKHVGADAVRDGQIEIHQIKEHKVA